MDALEIVDNSLHIEDTASDDSAYHAADSAALLPRLSIFGLGYVGAVSVACFGDLGHRVVGVDIDAAKVDRINAGISPMVELDVPKLLRRGVAMGRVSATIDVRNALHETDISFICVGTPSATDGSCDLRYLQSACENIGAALATKEGYHVLVFRSTIPPGTTRNLLLPIIAKASGKEPGVDFGVAFHPEFLRESTAVADFFAPPKTVVGGIDARSIKAVADLYKDIDEDVLETSLEAAEMVKYVDNTWHALKVSFANEIGKICKVNDIDSHDVMEIFIQDTKLNLSPYYLKPGYAFGGSCLPKDVREIGHLARMAAVTTPLLDSILPSNHAQIQHAMDLITRLVPRRVSFLGLTFKAGTDDLRESPMLPLLTALAEQGVAVQVFDPHLDLKGSVRHHLAHARHSKNDGPDLATMLPEVLNQDLDAVMAHGDVVIVGHRTQDFQAAIAARREGQHVIDLVRLFDQPEDSDTYHGICW